MVFRLERIYGIGMILGGMRTDPAHWNFEEKCRDFAEFCGADGGVPDLYVFPKFLFYIQGI